MCSFEVFGDWHRPCSHFVVSYYSGEKQDCNSSTCFHSASHAHKAEKCLCPRAKEDKRRIVNMFQLPCDACKTAAFDQMTRRD